MASRRIIATIRDGKSVVAEDSLLPSNFFESVPGFDPAVIWKTSGEPTVPWDTTDPVPTLRSVLPEIGGTTLWRVTFPPDAVMMADDFDGQAAGAEYMAKLPGLAETFEPENPGMHRSDTIDYDIVLEGEIWVEFDDGAMVKLEQGDILIQYGTRHAWRNLSDKPATLIFVLVGATRL